MQTSLSPTQNPPSPPETSDRTTPQRLVPRQHGYNKFLTLQESASEPPSNQLVLRSAPPWRSRTKTREQPQPHTLMAPSPTPQLVSLQRVWKACSQSNTPSLLHCFC
ncbi:hypothetical protein V8G54_032335, partial [Vigna mungo]